MPTTTEIKPDIDTAVEQEIEIAPEIEPEPEPEEETVQCTICQNEFSKEDIQIFDGENICQDCLDSETYICDRCCDRVWQSNSTSDDNITLCNDCYDDHYHTCCSCDIIIHCDSTYYWGDNDDDPLCRSCYAEREGEEKSIHNYSYKPTPIFFGDESNLHLGVELELDEGGRSNTNATELLNLANENGDHIYMKHDSSLNNGFEIVTHPMTLEYHQHKMDWGTILSEAISRGYRSHQCSTCGLHVHVSRCALGDSIEDQEETIARILFFIEKHWNEMLLFSRRTQTQINRWATRYGYKDCPKDIFETAKNHEMGRYTCINLQNYYTIEFRIFRGSLKYETLIATLQMVHEISNVALSIADEEFKAMAWQQFVANINSEIKPELVDYLKLKRLYVNEPVLEEMEDM